MQPEEGGMIVVARAVIIQNDQLLLLHNTRYGGPGYWVLPGGHVDPGERIAQALLRELQEELDWKNPPEPRFLGMFEQRYARPEGHYVQELCCIFRIPLRGPVQLESQEPGLAVHWCPLAQLGQQPLRPLFLARYLQDWLEGPDHHGAFRTPELEGLIHH